jgi:AcrR family transcriptional regulator
VLAQEGPRAVSTRRIAAETGCSTMAIYTLFGGKEGVVHALYLDGFERLRERLDAVPRTDDPLADLEALGWAYRDNALANRDLYAVMYGHLAGGFSPPPESVNRTKRSFQVMVEAGRRCMAAGILRPVDPVEVADVLWAAAHGMVSLELAGYYPEPSLAEARYGAMLYAAVAGYLAPPATVAAGGPAGVSSEQEE